MKSGKDEEKTMGPMFPRLHVNDTEKGGPRAPPRNKMALYEQLSIPSQRFNTGLLPLNPNNNNNLSLPSSSQGSGHERGMFFPHQLPPSVRPAEKKTRHTDLNPTLVQIEPKKRQEEEDFMGPIFVQSNKRQDQSINNNSVVKERRSLFSSADSDHFVKFQNTSEKEPKQLDTSGLNLRQGDIRQSEDNSKEFVALRETSNNFDSNKSFKEKSECPLKQIHASSSFKHMDKPPNYFHRLNDTNDSLQREYSENDGASIDHSRDMDHINSSILMGDLQQEEQRSPNTPTNDAESREDTCRSLQTGILDRDDASETSMVDSMSGTYLSPDDAVEIIGHKHFWKARRAIVKQHRAIILGAVQQRVFAVQVFELHRLIKVQRLIAESPHILLEDGDYLRKPLKGAPEKRIPLDYIVKNTPMIVKHKEFSEKPDNRMESSAENAVEKTSLSSSQNGSQPSSYGPFLGNPHPTTVNSDPKMGSWGFNQPSGFQWLVPVMTPFEGLVYKPYPGPGFMGPVYGHPGSTPIMGNYLNYGVQIPHHPCEGLGTASFAPPAGHGYFPPFGMPVMHPSFAGSADHTDHFNMPYQASCNLPSRKKNGAVPNAVKLNPSTDSEVQVSTASSTSNQRTRKTKVAHTSEGRNALPLFPTSPVVNVPDGGVEQPTRVIKVVPHNARSATESVARIFQSIQQERKQYDSV